MTINNLLNKTILITSREPYNQEGNSHMHYLEILLKTNKVIFIEPAKHWPPKNFKYQVNKENLTIYNYYNLIPYKPFPKLAGKINDLITCFLLHLKLKKEKPLILWQFDPYYLEKIPFLKIWKKVYFPLDGYSRDERDAIFAKRADLLTTVNSTFIDHYYHKYNKNILLLPHGFSDFQLSRDDEEVSKIEKEFKDFVVLTGSLSVGVDYKLLENIALSVAPKKLVIIGKTLVPKGTTKSLFEKPNVVYLGLKSYKVLKNYIAAAKCCIVAYDKGTGTWRNPIKITDYIAQYKPIVNTISLKDLANLESKIMYTTQNREQFIKWINLSLEDSLPVDNEFITEYISQNHYRNLVSLIDKKIV